MRASWCRSFVTAGAAAAHGGRMYSYWGDVLQANDACTTEDAWC